MFVDHVRVRATAGKGGTGCVSFRREKFVPKGGPDGGDGGRGGDVILVADPNTDNLAAFHYEPLIRAKSGENGQGKNCYGKAAHPTIVRVPVGTLVYRMPMRDEGGHNPNHPNSFVTFIDFAKQPEEPDEPIVEEPVEKPKFDPSELELIADLTTPGEEFVLCKGGEGGRGNVHFKSSRNRVPRQSTPGEEGEEGEFYLELRKIADAGLVGYPNAGKSTLLGAISAAKPKVAAYPFTTLHPIVGVVEFPGYSRTTIADIPGLIEGAHKNVGLGHEFLRHIVRCRLLIHVIDMGGSEGRDPREDLSSLRQELKLYDPALADRPWLVVANKMDLPEAAENLKAFKRRFRKPEIIPISAASSEGLDRLRNRLQELVANKP